jgi:predicted nucleotidyltransferase
MRLTAEQTEMICRITREVAGDDSSVRLFGSRLNDTQRGGDIDLLVHVTHPVDNPALIVAQLSARIMRTLGGRRVDVLLAAPNLQALPIHAHAMAEGVPL